MKKKPIWLLALIGILCFGIVLSASAADILKMDSHLSGAGSAPKTEDTMGETGEIPEFHSAPTSVTTLIQRDALEVLDEQGVEELTSSMEKYAPAQETLVINNAPEFYYYEELEPIEQEMYDIMLMIAQDPVEENIGVMMTDMDPQSDDFFVSYCKAYYSMVFDHPELFWLYNSIEDDILFASDVIMKNGIYIVFFKLSETFEKYTERMTQFNQAAQEFLADINLYTSEYEIVRQVHDKLINQVAYNHPVCDRQDYKDYAHTAYGALVQDSLGNPHSPVCDGYTLAFEYLLQQCGIEAIYIGGSAGDTIWNTGGHAWSMVKIDGNWFEVDSTWDDTWNDLRDYNDPDYDEMLDDAAFHERLEHYLFLISTERITDYNADIDYFTYYYKDGMHYTYFQPDSVHIRDSNADGLTMKGTALYAANAVIDMAPLAMFDYIY